MKSAIAVAFAAAALASTGALAQSYPQKTVRVVVPYAPGGNTDFTARVIAAKLTDVFGQQIVVENRPGGGTNIGSELVAKAPADGYTLLMGGASNAINMSFYPKMPYDTLRDFAPVILCVKGANVLSVHPSLPAKNLQELIALAKARPGQLNYASSGLGSSNMMAGELLKLMAGSASSTCLTGQLAGADRHHRPGRNAFQRRAGVAAAYQAGGCARSRSAVQALPALPDVPTIDASAQGLRGDDLVRPDGAGENPAGNRGAAQYRIRQDLVSTEVTTVS